MPRQLPEATKAGSRALHDHSAEMFAPQDPKSAFNAFPHIARLLAAVPGWNRVDHGAVEAALEGYSLEAEEGSLEEFLDCLAEPESQTSCFLEDYFEEYSLPHVKREERAKIRKFFSAVKKPEA